MGFGLLGLMIEILGYLLVDVPNEKHERISRYQDPIVQQNWVVSFCSSSTRFFEEWVVQVFQGVPLPFHLTRLH